MHKNIFIVSNYCVVFFMTTICFGCSTISAHDNFLDALNSSIGQNIDNVPSYRWPHESDLISSAKMKNGNLENRYRYIRSCVLIFEVDSSAREIVKANFEGNAADCVINP